MTDQTPGRDRTLKRRQGAKYVWGTAIACIFIAGFLAVWALNRNHSDAVDAKTLGVQIQKERARNTLASCLETNRRHDLTIARLDEAIAALPPDRRISAQVNRKSTVALIQALAPKRDCAVVVRRQVSQP